MEFCPPLKERYVTAGCGLTGVWPLGFLYANMGQGGTTSVPESVKTIVSFLWNGEDHPHFKYAFNKNADADRAQLAKDLVSAGVK